MHDSGLVSASIRHLKAKSRPLGRSFYRFQVRLCVCEQVANAPQRCRFVAISRQNSYTGSIHPAHGIAMSLGQVTAKSLKSSDLRPSRGPLSLQKQQPCRIEIDPPRLRLDAERAPKVIGDIVL